MKKKDKEIDSMLAEDLILSITESFYASGIFSDDDIKDKKSHVLALKRIMAKDGLDEITIDHTQSLSSKAREYKKANKFDYSRMFYATFFEHQINQLIHLYCLRNKIDSKTQTSIIQSVNIYGKFTWLLELMNYPKFNKIHLTTIKNLADSRNSFVHYKWKDNPDFHKVIDSDKEKLNIDTEFDKIEKAVKYFKNYCSRINFKGKKEHLKKLIK